MTAQARPMVTRMVVGRMNRLAAIAEAPPSPPSISGRAEHVEGEDGGEQSAAAAVVGQQPRQNAVSTAKSSHALVCTGCLHAPGSNRGLGVSDGEPPSCPT